MRDLKIPPLRTVLILRHAEDRREFIFFLSSFFTLASQIQCYVIADRNLNTHTLLERDRPFLSCLTAAFWRPDIVGISDAPVLIPVPGIGTDRYLYDDCVKFVIVRQ